MSSRNELSSWASKKKEKMDANKWKRPRDLSKVDIKILRTIANGRCMFRKWKTRCSCPTLEKRGDGYYPLAEAAHILPHSPNWPRGEGKETEDSYRNRLLLCPTHHTMVDNDPEMYTKEVMYEIYNLTIEEFEKNQKWGIGTILESNTNDLLVKYHFFVEKMLYLDKTANGVTLGKEKKEVIVILEHSYVLLWHFIRNAKWNNWVDFLWMDEIKFLFKKYKDNPTIAHIILRHNNDNKDKRILEIYEILSELYIEDFWVISSILDKLKEWDVEDDFRKKIIQFVWLKPISTHSYVRRAVLELSELLLDSDIKFVISIIEDTINIPTNEEDVKVWQPSLSLIFQWRDESNFVFWEAMSLLSKILHNDNYYEIAFLSIIKLFNVHLEEKNKVHEVKEIQWIKLDYLILNEQRNCTRDLKYEHDKSKRYIWELRGFLNFLLKTKDKAITLKFLELLINEKRQVYYILVIEFIRNNLKSFLDLAKRLVFDRNLRKVKLICIYFLQNLIKEYFSISNKGINKFISLANVEEESIKFLLFKAIPEHLQPNNVKKFLYTYSSKESLSLEIEPIISFSSASFIPPKKLSIGTKKEKVLDFIINNCKEESHKVDIYDLRPTLSSFIGKDINLVKYLLNNLIKKGIHERTIQGILSIGCVIIDEETELDIKLERLIELLALWKEYDGISIIPVLQSLEKLLTKSIDENINLISKNVPSYKQLKELLFELKVNKNPTEDDEKLEESWEIRVDRGITVAINSVRGISLEVLIRMFFLNPDDKEIEKYLTTSFKEELVSIQANSLFCLRFLIYKNYDFFKKTINSYENYRNIYTDYSISLCLRKVKFDDIRDFSNIIYNIIKYSTQEEIQENMGILLANLIMKETKWFEQHKKDVFSWQIGNTFTYEGMLRVFVESLKLWVLNKDEKVIDKSIKYIKEVLETKNVTPEEKSELFRLLSTYFIDGTKRWTQGFLCLYNKGFFNYLVNNFPSYFILHKEIIEGMDSLLKKDKKVLETTVNTLYLQTTFEVPIFIDSLLVGHIKNILIVCFDSIEDISIETIRKAIFIFDKGLETWYNDFYDLYDKYFKNWLVDISECSQEL